MANSVFNSTLTNIKQPNFSATEIHPESNPTLYIALAWQIIRIILTSSQRTTIASFYTVIILPAALLSFALFLAWCMITGVAKATKFVPIFLLRLSYGTNGLVSKPLSIILTTKFCYKCCCWLDMVEHSHSWF